MAKRRQKTPASPSGNSGRLQHVLNAVYCEPWLIRPEMHAQIRDIVARHLDPSLNHAAVEAQFPEQEPPVAEQDEEVAIVPIKGVIGKGISGIERSSGVTDVADVQTMLEWAMESNDISAVLLDIDSPGGTVGGVPELADFIAEVDKQKPVFAFADGMAASAAYWLGSQARALYAVPSSVVGSVGVYLAVLDQSRAFENAGYHQDVIKAGKFKGAGIPGTTLTDEQRAQLQERVNYIHELFKSSVTRNRRGISDESMQGQDFFAEQGMVYGLVDELAKNRGEVVAELKRYVS